MDQLGLRIAAYALEEESALPWFSLAGEGQRHRATGLTAPGADGAPRHRDHRPRAAGLSVEAHKPQHATDGAVDTTVNSVAVAGEIEQPI